MPPKKEEQILPGQLTLSFPTPPLQPESTSASTEASSSGYVWDSVSGKVLPARKPKIHSGQTQFRVSPQSPSVLPMTSHSPMNTLLETPHNPFPATPSNVEYPLSPLDLQVSDLSLDSPALDTVDPTPGETTPLTRDLHPGHLFTNKTQIEILPFNVHFFPFHSHLLYTVYSAVFVMFSLHASADFNISFNEHSPELIAKACGHDNPVTSQRHDSPQPDITPSYMNLFIKNKRKIYKESLDQGPHP
ncbi:hypothetical protein K435DRAFT_872999 [Dendrothele bispora CBS 962.96]|uniref:Uncharacterized protein n=1 Tax=Dendrothele bispora (strain CBS 962.96) TaxID=1314807 RepID=A0A4S8L0F2_DENBC|nr:hypothetical protein K435DRAFT_872999 [Dendrothele bispora CBS 962.96]